MSMLVAAPALAQSYPTKPVTILSAVPPGGPLDWLGRTVGARLQERLGQPYLVDARPGAGGAIAIQALQKAVPDGHTLFVFAQNAVAIPLFNKNVTFQPGVDIQALTPAFYSPYVIMSSVAIPPRTLADFITYAKANPGKLNWAAVPGTGQWLSSYTFIKQNGLDIQLVPYQGAAPGLRSVMANETQAYYGTAQGLDELVKAGKVVALAMASPKRFVHTPDLPTVKELIGQDVDVTVQYGFFATFGTPRPIVDRLAKEMADIVMNTDMRPQILKQGYEPLVMSPDEWTKVMLREQALARQAAAESGIKPQ